MKYYQFNSLKEFYQADVLSTWFEVTHFQIQDDWQEVKRLLKHKDCPDSIRNIYINSPVWYHRLVAYCTAPVRQRFFKAAIKDPKSTVRAAAYRGAIGTKWMDQDELFKLIQQDKGIQ
jgi:hypothetical protein